MCSHGISTGGESLSDYFRVLCANDALRLSNASWSASSIATWRARWACSKAFWLGISESVKRLVRCAISFSRFVIWCTMLSRSFISRWITESDVISRSFYSSNARKLICARILSMSRSVIVFVEQGFDHAKVRHGPMERSKNQVVGTISLTVDQ